MADEADASAPASGEYAGVYIDGVIRLQGCVNWPNGTHVLVCLADLPPGPVEKPFGKVIIAGFGLAGRWVADIFDRHHITYTIVEQNRETIEAQRHLGREVIEGDIAVEQTLRRAGIQDAAILALTIPDEKAVLDATRLARQIKPDIYIVARTNYSSAGMKAAQLGADDVVKAEQAVARQFYEMMLRKLSTEPKSPAADSVPNRES